MRTDVVRYDEEMDGFQTFTPEEYFACDPGDIADEEFGRERDSVAQELLEWIEDHNLCDPDIDETYDLEGTDSQEFADLMIRVKHAFGYD